MKVSELRELAKKAEKEKLEKALAECYKMIPKAKKEEADDIIVAVFHGEDVKKAKEEKAINFPALKAEVERFLENAYAQNYVAPNRIISKKERPKWRFLVMGYIKEFLKMHPADEHYEEMLTLFGKVYKLLCTACNYYVFSTEDPFRSINWEQSALFEALLEKLFYNGYPREKIAEAIKIAVYDGVSRENLKIFQAVVLNEKLPTMDVKEIALEEVKKQVEETEKKLYVWPKYSENEYEKTEKINCLCDLYLIVSIDLAEEKEGLDYYFKHTKETDAEIILYKALSIVSMMKEDDDNQLWIDTYRYGLTRKIKPRRSLVETYQKKLEEQKGNQKS